MKWFSLAFAISVPCAAFAQDVENEPRYYDDELYSETVHSDLPLYNYDWDPLWPRPFSRSEGENYTFGCESQVQFGDWEFSHNPADEFTSGWWMRVRNYGVFHCAASFMITDERGQLEDGAFSRGYFVRLGIIGEAELWAIQEGMVPGSSYILLSRPAAEEITSSFSVLQRRCPDGAMRELQGGLDYWITDYCAINSQEDLLALAIEMLGYPHLGTLTRIGDSDWKAPPESEEQEPVPEDGTFLLEALSATSDE